MYIGFFTACFPQLSLEEVVKWAQSVGFGGLEIACWPRRHERDYASSHIDVLNLTPENAQAIKELFKKGNLRISSLGYYDNNLHPDIEKRNQIHQHLYKVIEAAKMLEVDLVGTFIGRNPDLTIEENFNEYKKVFPEIVSYAKQNGVRLMIENCPMYGWQKPELVGNIAYSPENWEKMFSIIPDEHFGLNFDPSHLLWLGVDYIDVIKKFANRIFHVHAKDAEVVKPVLKNTTIYGKGWWRHRLPSMGEIDWRRFILTLLESGYDGVLSIEHEDPVFEGSEEKVKKGLILAYRFLNLFI